MIPDHDDPNIACHHCHNLHHYLVNATKYFTSNTQLFFLPGIHHLDADIIIQNVHNISLVGSTRNGTTVIQCKTNCSIVLENCSTVTINNLSFKNTSIETHHCHHLFLQSIIVTYRIIVANAFGNSYISDFSSQHLQILYSDVAIKTKNHAITVQNYKPLNTTSFKALLLTEFLQVSYAVNMNIIDSTFENFPMEGELRSLLIIRSESCGGHINTIIISNCNFLHSIKTSPNSMMDELIGKQVVRITLPLCVHRHTTVPQPGNTRLLFNNTTFINNNISMQTDQQTHAIIRCIWHMLVTDAVSKVTKQIVIKDCKFDNNTVTHVLYFQTNRVIMNIVYIIHTNFTSNIPYHQKPPRTYILSPGMIPYTPKPTSRGSIITSDSQVTLAGPITFCNNSMVKTLLNTSIQLQGYIEFSQNKVDYLVLTSVYTTINFIQYATLNITGNNVGKTVFHSEAPNDEDIIPPCYFQFYASHKQNFTMSVNLYKIMIANTTCNQVFAKVAQNINCKMFPNSVFYGHNPLHVYQHIINFKNTSKNYNSSLFDTGTLCYCSEEDDQSCQTNTLGTIYPGQTITAHLRINLEYSDEYEFIDLLPVNVEMHHNYLPPTHCKVSFTSETFVLVKKNCTKLFYTILSSNEGHCELYLNAKYYNKLTIFFINLHKCPIGFSFIDATGKCECEPSLKTVTAQCNINDQTVLRLANSWISAESNNNSHSYYISHSCPFHYCLPHLSSLDFSTPNSQCQFNRSNLLCGECQQGLSTVFGSSHCQHCSNVYLLLILPIMIVGILLVLLLFLLNLTVTEGTINAFVLYVNIISINSDVFFANAKHVPTSATYIFISLANLDLGTKVCFYNGMDDYAKMWLQLIFPIYLIFIATLLIVTSRYSTTVQRLTARRALPVLATLFLLSYTKILRTVSSVLFFYSTITHLPSKLTKLVWSVDANVLLFGVRFTLLFIVCLIFFLILLPFNIILLFTRTLSRFQLVSKFKPLLDAYQGPYKLNFYYWTGLQLVIRAVFFGVAALDKNINLIIGGILLSVMIGLHGLLRPFKNSVKNYHELVFLINLQVLYIFSLSSIGATAVDVMIAMAALQFTIIFTNNMISYMYGGVIGKKLQDYTSTVTKSMQKKMKMSKVTTEQIILQNIPDKTYNYQEYQEPLLGED